MGLLGPNEVGEFTVLRDLAPVPNSTTDFAATAVRLNTFNFIAFEGSRIQDVTAAPKYWRQAFIVLTNDIHKVHGPCGYGRRLAAALGTGLYPGY